MPVSVSTVCAALAVVLAASSAAAQPGAGRDACPSSGPRYIDLRPANARPGAAYRLKSVKLRRRVIWGAAAVAPDGGGLAFGGQDQRSEDGRPHTCVRRDDRWVSIHGELRRGNPLQPFHDRVWALRGRQQLATAKARHIYFEGRDGAEQAREAASDVAPILADLSAALGHFADELSAAGRDGREYHAGQARRAAERMRELAGRSRDLAERAARAPERRLIGEMSRVRIELERISELLDAEPPPRAQSPLVYEPGTGLYFLFGGDHFDYLTNDTWAFDPAGPQWRQLHPAAAPPPRANHVLTAAGDGTLTLSGGYAYTSQTAYMSPQYRDVDAGTWTYDVRRNRWTGPGEAMPPDHRVYRSGPFTPDFFLQGPRPDAAATARVLDGLAVNRWTRMRPPFLPKLNRDWGAATLDPERGLILRWSGGHSAHGGTDVLHYHLATNRWELPFPISFPLGQLYSNTSYPAGFTFNRRPWMITHTYQSYGYDLAARRMLFAGGRRHTYVYDPDRGDWIGRIRKPPGMTYAHAHYSLTLAQTGQGLVAWTGPRRARHGDLFRFDRGQGQWRRVSFRGVTLPTSTTDNAGVAYDTKRRRLIFARKPYSGRFDGTLHELDVNSRVMKRLSPQGAAAAAAIRRVFRLQYDPRNDLILVGAQLAPDADGVRRMPAYDPGRNRWISLRIDGESPMGRGAANVSLGLVYDDRRGLFWAVDAWSRVYVLRLDAASADPQPLERTAR